MARYDGQCLCAKLRFAVSGEVRDLCICHCTSCRRASGAPCVAWGTVDLAQFALLRGSLALLRSSRDVERGFCANCGTSLTYRNLRRGREIDFTLAVLDDPAPLEPRAHIWVSEKLPWPAIVDGLPQLPTALRPEED